MRRRTWRVDVGPAARRRLTVLGLAALLVLGGVVHREAPTSAPGELVGRVVAAARAAAAVPQQLLAPAYDAASASSVRNLTTALQSYALLEGDLAGVTVAELADWGWTPQDAVAVTVWVEGASFRIAARDTRPGGGTWVVDATDPARAPVLARDDAWAGTTPSAPGTAIVVGLP